MSAGTTPRRLVLVGSVVVDVNLRVPRLPERGGDVLAGSLSIAAGGGLFVLRAAVRGGLPAVYAGRHGGGPFGEVVRTALGEDGVSLAYEAERVGDTGPCVVLVEPDGERTMVTSNGVESVLDRDRLEQLAVRDDDAVYVSGYDLSYPVTGPAVAGWAPGIPADAVFVVDPGPLVADIPAAVLNVVLARTDVLTLSIREAELLTGSAVPADVAYALTPRLARSAVIILRAGPHGATVLAGGAQPVEVPVVPVEATDTTGAGDTHTGALLAARAAGRGWPAAVDSANGAVRRLLAARL